MEEADGTPQDSDSIHTENVPVWMAERYLSHGDAVMMCFTAADYVLIFSPTIGQSPSRCRMMEAGAAGARGRRKRKNWAERGRDWGCLWRCQTSMVGGNKAPLKVNSSETPLSS